jgi:hypothetical protein
LQRENGFGEGSNNHYTLSFTFDFPAGQDDEVWFAHAVPYTYTDLNRQLVGMRDNAEFKSFLRLELLGLSLSRLPVPMMTITEGVGSYMEFHEELRLFNTVPPLVRKRMRQLQRDIIEQYSQMKRRAAQGKMTRQEAVAAISRRVDGEVGIFHEQNQQALTDEIVECFRTRLLALVTEHSHKQAIVLTCRVHPGECQSNHMLNGLLSTLTSPAATPLRKAFVFRIVPMLNPDGVVFGNYRCSQLGSDLNRKWDCANRLLHPTIFYSKLMIRMMRHLVRVQVFVDFHGHNRKQGAFFYGGTYFNYEQDGRTKNALIRILPLMCCQKNRSF